MADLTLGGVRIEIRGDTSQLMADFAAAEAAGQRAAATISGNLTASFGRGTGIVDAYGRAIAATGAAATSAAPPTDRLAASVSRLAGNVASTATTSRILTDALQTQTAATAAATNAQMAGGAAVAQVGQQIGSTLTAMAASAAAANSMKETYLSLGLAVRTIRIAEQIYRGVEAIAALYTATRDAIPGIDAAFGDLGRSVRAATDELVADIARVQVKQAELTGKQPDLKALGMAQVAVDFDKTADQIIKKFDELNADFKKEAIGPVKGFFIGQMPTTGALGTGGGMADTFNREAKTGTVAAGIVTVLTETQQRLAAAYAAGKDQAEQYRIVQEGITRVQNLEGAGMEKLNSYVERYTAITKAAKESGRGAWQGVQTATSGLEEAKKGVEVLGDLIKGLPRITVSIKGKEDLDALEKTRAVAQRAAVVPLASNEAQMTAIKQVTEARAQASALDKAQRDAAIESIEDPHERAMAAAQAELKARQDTLAASRAQQAVSVPQEVSAVQRRGALEQQGKAPEEARAAQIRAQEQAQGVITAALREQSKAEDDVAVAAAKVLSLTNEQARVSKDAVEATRARTEAAVAGASAERQVLEQERAAVGATRSTGDPKIARMQQQADLQKAMDAAAVESLYARADAEKDSVKSNQLIGEAVAKVAENSNKEYAAVTKIISAEKERLLLLAEIVQKQTASVATSGLELQKAQVQRAATLAPPALTTAGTAQNQIAAMQQVAAIDKQIDALHVKDLQTQSAIHAAYGDEVGALSLKAQAQEAAAVAAVKEYETQTAIAKKLEEQNLQYQLMAAAAATLQAIPSAIGGAVAQGLFEKPKKGESVGQDIEKALENAGKKLAEQLTAKALTAGLEKLAAVITGQTPPQTANTVAINANTAAVTANTTAVGAGGAGGATSAAGVGKIQAPPQGTVPPAPPIPASATVTGTAPAAAAQANAGVIQAIGTQTGQENAALASQTATLTQDLATGFASVVAAIESNKGGGIASGILKGVLGAIPLVGPLLSGIGGGGSEEDGGGASDGGGAAWGGDISGPTLVGEKGPELFIPKTPGTVIPAGRFDMAAAQALMGGPAKAPNIFMPAGAAGGAGGDGAPGSLGWNAATAGAEFGSPAFASGSTSMTVGELHFHGITDPRSIADEVMRILPGRLKRTGPQFSPVSRGNQGSMATTQ